MKLASHKNCTGCMTCSDACPHQCITATIAPDGHLYPLVDKTQCIDCKYCERVCPVLNPIAQHTAPPLSHAAWSLNNALRMKSSSGGFFAQVAVDFIKNGGCVVGASMQGLKVRHIVISSPDEISKIQGSKYLQSNCQGIYSTVLKILKQGKRVLFSGTPCQVAGIYKLVPVKLQDLLYTMDLICTGVPSRLILDKFLEHTQPHIKQILSFRDKSWSEWKNGYAMTCLCEDGTLFKSKDNFYFGAFSGKKTNRYSCYTCLFQNSIHRHADITFGDCWGNNDFKDEMAQGISLVIVHTDKGEELLNNSHLSVHNVDFTNSIKANRNYFMHKDFRRFHPARKFLPYTFKHWSIFSLNEIYVNNTPWSKTLFYPFYLMDSIVYRLNRFIYKSQIKNLSNEQ